MKNKATTLILRRKINCDTDIHCIATDGTSTKRDRSGMKRFKGAVSRNQSAKLGNYKMQVKLRET